MSYVLTSGIYPYADWRNAEHYRPLLDYDRVGWAGQWLRRNVSFIADAEKARCFSHSNHHDTINGIPIVTCEKTCPLKRWGLHYSHMKDEPFFFWLPRINPFVLTLEATTVQDTEDAFDFQRCSLLKASLSESGQETHFLFGNEARTLQLVVKGNITTKAPLHLSCALSGWREFEIKPLTMQRLCGLHRQGHLLASLYSRERRARRWIEMLRAWDGLQSGVKQREIAATIYGERAAHDGWDSGYRSRVQRLIRSAERMVSGGYLDLLHQASAQKTKP